METDSINSTVNFEGKPLCLIVIGMAGSGKTTFVKALKDYLNEHDKPAYTINIDPAVHFMPYEPNIDIRDVINYKEVMREHNLGPNGGILTSVNLFSTKMNEVVDLISKSSHLTNHVIIDTPGQIEVFKWSASGKIVTETLSSSFPTAIIYVIDCSRSTNPITFLSNMIYASGVAVEYELPFIMVMNKKDIIDSQYLENWMSDVTVFLDEIDGQDLGFMTTLTRQLIGALDKFYVNLPRCGVSSYTGDGFSELFDLLKSARNEFFNVYLKEILPARQINDVEEEGQDGTFLDLLQDKFNLLREKEEKQEQDEDEDGENLENFENAD